jgi:riboflavin kinase
MAQKPNEVKIKGKVSSGKGIGKKFVELSWAQKQFTKKLGFNPYPGTLNLILTRNDKEKKRKLEKLRGITIIPEKGYCEAKCFKAKIDGKLQAAIIFPKVSGYPEGLLEVLSPLNLKKALNLKDGDKVKIIVYLE